MIRADELYSGATVTPLLMDLSNLMRRRVQQSAELLLRDYEKLDMLFLNMRVYL